MIPLLWHFVIHLPQLQATSAGMMYFVYRNLLLQMPPWLTVFRFGIFCNLTWQLSGAPLKDKPLALSETQPQTIRHRWYRVWMQHSRKADNHLLATRGILVLCYSFFLTIVSISMRPKAACIELDINREIWEQTCHLPASEINNNNKKQSKKNMFSL